MTTFTDSHFTASVMFAPAATTSHPTPLGYSSTYFLVDYSGYTGATCAAPATSFFAYTANACIVDGASSFEYDCANDAVPVRFEYEGTKCQGFAEGTVITANTCLSAPAYGGVPYPVNGTESLYDYETISCLTIEPVEPIGYYYTTEYADIGCTGTIVSTFGYAAGSCQPYSATQSVLYDCEGTKVLNHNSPLGHIFDTLLCIVICANDYLIAGGKVYIFDSLDCTGTQLTAQTMVLGTCEDTASSSSISACSAVAGVYPVSYSSVLQL
jgi:hypothetical protein